MQESHCLSWSLTPFPSQMAQWEELNFDGHGAEMSAQLPLAVQEQGQVNPSEPWFPYLLRNQRYIPFQEQDFEWTTLRAPLTLKWGCKVFGRFKPRTVTGCK